MELAIAIGVGVFFAGGIYLLMKRHLFEVLLGTMLISHATNLLLISLGGWRRGEKPPIVSEEHHIDPAPFIDPIPQALILTAIVIGFGVTAFLVVLCVRGYESTGSMEVGELPRGEHEP